ncbi:Glutamyl-tRNA reductase [Capnocytophaga canimorsus]|uniref:Glutamyl-tRNA reductase n=2 Tax=Capnocytophaga canimorsus TaxID=28188 RepID=A0A0B7HAZ3_9FLAO|nr:glutamyl-tRNA reductase [Capnocytophaga canimorsus]CEN34763.1 Glutamyl-tRNA reductase [Capnocytophaga canimorsus]STA72912.1 Glutamyl-tRNA reductase [Capnocytophaga canimorsus]
MPSSNDKLGMNQHHLSKNKSFYCVGLSYKKADAATRGLFSLSAQNKQLLLEKAKFEGFDELLVISTCNRTELYGYAEHPFQLIQLLCEFSCGTVDAFQKIGYVRKNREAVQHLFEVGTGLDSQILGDFEIIGQLKQSFSLSRQCGVANAFTERLLNSVISASKRIKNETGLSSGAASVSFAAVQYILQHIPEVSQKNILLFGLGKIGRNTCENLIKHTQNKHITLINRTKEKAEQIAGKFNLLVKDYKDLDTELAKADVLVVATGAQTPTVSKENISGGKKCLILDLSVPKNVKEDVEQVEGVTLVHMDALSQMTSDAMERRKTFIPQAKQIISEVSSEFFQWLDGRRFAPAIQALKSKLENMKNAELDFQRKKIANFNEEQAEIISNRIIQKITTHFVNHLKDSDTSEESVAWMQQVFQLEMADI